MSNINTKCFPSGELIMHNSIFHKKKVIFLLLIHFNSMPNYKIELS